jgi:copper chaperone
MIAFQVDDMTCNHCVSTITEAVRSADHGAQVQVDLSARRVQVERSSVSAQALAAAIREAGYTPVPVTA